MLLNKSLFREVSESLCCEKGKTIINGTRQNNMDKTPQKTLIKFIPIIKLGEGVITQFIPLQNIMKPEVSQ